MGYGNGKGVSRIMTGRVGFVFSLGAGVATGAVFGLTTHDELFGSVAGALVFCCSVALMASLQRQLPYLFGALAAALIVAVHVSPLACAVQVEGKNYFACETASGFSMPGYSGTGTGTPTLVWTGTGALVGAGLFSLARVRRDSNRKE